MLWRRARISGFLVYVRSIWLTGGRGGMEILERGRRHEKVHVETIRIQEKDGG